MSYRGNEPPAGKAGRDMDDSAERGAPVMPDSGVLPLLSPPPQDPPRSPERRGGPLFYTFLAMRGQTRRILL